MSEPSPLPDRDQCFRALVDGLAVAVWQSAADGRPVDDGAEWRDETGLTPAQWAACGWLAAVHPHDRPRVEHQWRLSLADRVPLSIDCRLRRRAGGWRWTNVRAVPVHAGDGAAPAPARWAGIGIDIGERRQAEDALRDSEYRYRKLSETSPDGILVTVHDRIVYANPAAATLLGELQRHRLHGRSPTDFIAPECRGALLAQLLAAVQGSASAPLDLRWRRPCGSYAELEGHVTAVTWERDLALQWLLRDVAERKRRERNATFLAEVGVCLARSGSVDELAGPVAKMIGGHYGASRVSLAEIDVEAGTETILHEWVAEGREPRSGVRALAAGRTEARLRELAAGRPVAIGGAADEPSADGPRHASGGDPPALLEAPFVRGVRWRFLLSVTRDAPHRWIGEEIGLARDLCARAWTGLDRARAEVALRESEARLAAIFAAAPVGLAEIGPDGRFLRANAALSRMLARDAAELLTLRVADVTHPDDVDASLQAFALLVDTGAGVTLDKRYVWPDGTIVWAQSSLVHLAGEGPQPPRILAVTVDVTERRRAEHALRDAARRKDEFLATLAHELRNPLAPIRSAARILDREDLPAKDLAMCRDIIKRQAQHMAWLLDDLMDVSRVTRGRLKLKTELVALAEIVETALETTRPLIAARRHALVVDLPEVPLTVEADRVRLAQVVTNLLTNAAKYTDPGGEITLRVRYVDGCAQLAVRDTGIGLTARDLERVFEMFSQVDSAIDRAQGGLGIGLALVQGLVRMHGGRVEARSAGPGRGSEFVVTLPAEPAHAAIDGAAVPRELRPAAGRRVLVADDNRDAARTLEMCLRLAGHDVRVVHDGRAALELAESFRPQAALLDIGMPEYNGYQVARRLRTADWGRGILLVALTGWGQDEDKRLAREAGFDHHLTKPTDPDQLLALMGEGASAAVAPAGASLH